MAKCVYYFLFVFVSIVLIADVCQCKLCGCQLKNQSVIDLSSVANTSVTHKPRFALSHVSLVNNITVTDLIFYDPCNAFEQKIQDATTDQDDVPCDSVAACMYKTERDAAKIYALGFLDTAKCSEDQDHPTIKYTVPSKSASLTVHLECKESEHELVFGKSDDKNHNIEVTLRGRCACPDRCSTNGPADEPHRFSTGSILLITFFTLVLAYTVFGVLYNFCNGAKGAELCPHISFWSDLPQLIMDGFVFTCSCISNRGQTGYADI